MTGFRELREYPHSNSLAKELYIGKIQRLSMEGHRMIRDDLLSE